MILAGINCHNCGGPLRDQGEKCHRCNHPFNAFVLMIIDRHTAAKEALCEKALLMAQDDAELAANVMRLADATMMLSGPARAAENTPLNQEESQKLLDRAFQRIDEKLSN